MVQTFLTTTYLGGRHAAASTKSLKWRATRELNVNLGADFGPRSADVIR